MRSLEESVVIAMDGSDKELFTYLPYILQDIWEIGTDPDTVINLIGRHFDHYQSLRVLDLGCGKGAVSINTAKKYRCKCHGIDGIADFIRFAKQRAEEWGVDDCCTFEVGDIREAVCHLPRYDIIVLGAIGPVFGNYYTTLTTLSKNLNPNGAFIIDDAYIEDSSEFSHPLILSLSQLKEQVDNANMRLAENSPVSKAEVVSSDNRILKNLKRRCGELAQKYPDKKSLFMNYIKKQDFESQVNATKVVCTTMVIKPK
ncbi:putative methyltransferase [Chitinispirillum alkaliphilum]|nr:putative methyltransferase [Chitinispirillum alkaliphilum]